MIEPTVNINGSSAEDLINPRLEAVSHLLDAIEALRKVKPHGRDYLNDTRRCLADRDEHVARIAALKILREQLFTEALNIKGQIS